GARRGGDGAGGAGGAPAAAAEDRRAVHRGRRRGADGEIPRGGAAQRRVARRLSPRVGGVRAAREVGATSRAGSTPPSAAGSRAAADTAARTPPADSAP